MTIYPRKVQTTVDEKDWKMLEDLSKEFRCTKASIARKAIYEGMKVLKEWTTKNKSNNSTE